MKKVERLPDGLKKAENNVLAYGEVTGHKHLLKSSQICVFENANKQKFIDARQDLELVHEEHDPLLIKKGLYVVVHEQEYNPFDEAIRQVMD